MPNEELAKTKKPEESKKPKINKKLLLRACQVLVIFIVSAGAVWGVFTLINSRKPVLNDEYFVTDDTKSVVNMPASGNSASIMTRVVYTYDGDAVTGLKTYFEYPDEETAASALDSMKNLPEFANSKEVVLDGKFIVVVANEDQYKGLTASDAKQQTESINRMLNESKKDAD